MSPSFRIIMQKANSLVTRLISAFSTSVLYFVCFVISYNYENCPFIVTSSFIGSISSCIYHCTRFEMDFWVPFIMYNLTVLIVHRIVLFGPGSLLPRWWTEKQARSRCQLFIIYKCYSELFTSIDRTCERIKDFLN